MSYMFPSIFVFRHHWRWDVVIDGPLVLRVVTDLTFKKSHCCLFLKSKKKSTSCFHVETTVSYWLTLSYSQEMHLEEKKIQSIL